MKIKETICTESPVETNNVFPPNLEEKTRGNRGAKQRRPRPESGTVQETLPPSDSLVDQIKMAHDRVTELATNLKQHLLEFLNASRDTGNHLIEWRKGHCKHGDWMQNFKPGGNSNCMFNFSVETARRYMRLARAHPEPFTELPVGVRSLNDIFRASGIISEIVARNKKEAFESNFEVCLQSANKLKNSFRAEIKDHPLEEWSSSDRTKLKSRLQKIVDIHELLTGLPPSYD